MSKQVVLDFFSAETEEQCGHRIYKYTDCGAWIEFNDKGIKIGSIVEGCDFGTVIYTLNYADNFNSKDIQDRIDAVESEADALWIWANAMNDGENVYFRGFGSFILKKRATKVARNISKNTQLTIPEHFIPKFK